MSSGQAEEIIAGGDGDDVIHLTLSGSADVVDGGPGRDTVFYGCSGREAIDQRKNVEVVTYECIY
jgi:hypothetical protein